MQPVFDGHNDVLLRLWRNEAGGGDPVAEFSKGTKGPYRRPPRCQTGGLAGGLCAIYIPSGDLVLKEPDGTAIMQRRCPSRWSARRLSTSRSNCGDRPAARTRRRLAALPHHGRHPQRRWTKGLCGRHAYGRLRGDRRGSATRSKCSMPPDCVRSGRSGAATIFSAMACPLPIRCRRTRGRD